MVCFSAIVLLAFANQTPENEEIGEDFGIASPGAQKYNTYSYALGMLFGLASALAISIVLLT